MLNTVHPETGLQLNDGFEKRRAQEWAKQYELQQGRVYCEQRLKNPAEREDAPPRNVWMAFQENEKEFGRAEKLLQENKENAGDAEKNIKNSEWKLLKETQQAERKEFFAEGKSEFSQLRLSIYREVREEFRDRWANFYAAQKDGADPEFLANFKTDLIASQKAVLEERRDAACAELRESRDQRYRELLDGQRDIRADLRSRQEAGLENAPFLQQVRAETIGTDVGTSFRDAANEVALPHQDREWKPDAMPFSDAPGRDGAPAKSRTGGDDGIGLRIGVSAGSFLDALFCDLVGEGPRPYQPDEAETKHFRAAADDAVKQQQQRARDEADEEWRERQRSSAGG